MSEHLRLRCLKENLSNNRTVQRICRSQNLQITSIASNALGQRVFPVLRVDEVVKAIRFDKLIIMYANFQVEKYKESYHIDDMIRQKLKRLGRFLLIMRELEPTISAFHEIYNPVLCDVVIEAINKFSGISSDTRNYKTPSFALAMGTLIKEVKNKNISISNAKNFILLYKIRFL